MAVEVRMRVSIDGLAVVLLTWMCQGSELVVTGHVDMSLRPRRRCCQADFERRCGCGGL